MLAYLDHTFLYTIFKRLQEIMNYKENMESENIQQSKNTVQYDEKTKKSDYQIEQRV